MYIVFLQSRGPIDGLHVASMMRGSGPSTRLMRVCIFANTVLVTLYACASASEQAHGDSYCITF